MAAGGQNCCLELCWDSPERNASVSKHVSLYCGTVTHGLTPEHLAHGCQISVTHPHWPCLCALYHKAFYIQSTSFSVAVLKLPLSVYADSCSLCCVQIDVLKMGWCKIGEKDGAKAIADLILFNTSLTTLDLRGNGLGNAGKRF